jgi:hypothetical protein
MQNQECVENAKLEYDTPAGQHKIIECWMKPETEELLAMSTFYEEIYESDADIVQKKKSDREDDDGDDTKF